MDQSNEMKNEMIMKFVDDFRETHRSNYKIYVDSIRESSRSIDRTIILLASGVFGFSVIFIEKIGQQFVGLLLVSLLLLFISIVSTFFSFFLSMKSLETFMKMENEKMRQFNKILMDLSTGKIKADAGTVEVKINEEKNCWQKATSVLNNVSISFFISGYTVLFIYIMLNLLFKYCVNI
jgi:hypothetical protein